MITLKEIEVMLAVCEAGSFMGAARNLKITQGNVSKIVAALERKLGKALFIRTSDGVTLTCDGAYVQMYAEQIRILADKIRSDARAYTQKNAKLPEESRIA